MEFHARQIVKHFWGTKEQGVGHLTYQVQSPAPDMVMYDSWSDPLSAEPRVMPEQHWV